MTLSPAAFATITAHFEDTKTSPEDYDLIVTGDLGTIGVEALVALCREAGMEYDKLLERIIELGYERYYTKNNR